MNWKICSQILALALFIGHMGCKNAEDPLLELLTECRYAFDPSLDVAHQTRLSHFEAGVYCTRSYEGPFFRDLFFKTEDFHYAERQNRIFLNPRFEELPANHSYNYLLTTGGELLFGMVVDSWEMGVKHLHLAQGRTLLAAGEFRVRNDRSYEFNLMSGTFTLPMLSDHPEYRHQLATSIRSLFETEFGSRGQYWDSGSLLPTHREPDALEIRRICQFGDFALRNVSHCQPH